MRSDKEIAASVLKRAEKIKAHKERKNAYIRGSIAVLGCICVIFALSVFISKRAGSISSAGYTQRDVASSFAFSGVGGYFIVGMLAFAAGIAITLISRKHKKEDESDREDDERAD